MFTKEHPKPENYDRWLNLLERHGTEEQQQLYMLIKPHDKGLRKARPQDVPLGQLPRKIVEILAKEHGIGYMGQLMLAYDKFPDVLLNTKHVGGVGFNNIKHCVVKFREHLDKLVVEKTPVSSKFVLSMDQILRTVEQALGQEEALRVKAAVMATNDMLKTGNSIQDPDKFLKRAAKIKASPLPDHGDKIASQFREKKMVKKIKPIKLRRPSPVIEVVVSFFFVLGLLIPAIGQELGLLHDYMHMLDYPHHHDDGQHYYNILKYPHYIGDGHFYHEIIDAFLRLFSRHPDYISA